ncbi:hypothetical protein UlMin_034625 [Ulmus minor]
MINIVAISLLLTSLATAGVWSPTPKNQENDVIVKEGNRVVVVEYDKQGKSFTKVSVSDQENSFSPESSVTKVLGNTKETLKEGSSVLPNLGEGISCGASHHCPTGLICDAYGKCKHKIATAMGMAKDKVSETAREAKEEGHKVEEAVENKYERAKDTILNKAHEVEERAREKTRDVVRTASDMRETDVVKNVTGFCGWITDQAKLKAAYFAHLVSPEVMSPISGVLYVLGLSTAFGTSIWVTFIMSYVLAAAMPRQQFGMVQSKIYPVYFRTMAFSIAMALFGFWLSHRGKVFKSIPEKLQVFNLLAPFLMVLANMIHLEPRATKVMFEKMKVEKEEGRGREEIVTTETSRATEQPAATEPAPEQTVAQTETVVREKAVDQEAVRDRVVKLILEISQQFLNILSLMALSSHVYHIGQRLHLTY